MINKGGSRNSCSINVVSECRHIKLALLKGRLSSSSTAFTDGSYQGRGSNGLK